MDAEKQLAAALGRVASSLFVLTARHGDAETGMLCSWVQQCSFVPPMVSVAIRRDRDVTRWLTDGAAFTLNILDDTQTDMVIHFGRGFALDAPAFTGLAVERSETGPPVLSEALAYLNCQLVGRHSTGDHDLFIGQVVAGRLLGEGHPMIHIRKSGSHY